MKKIIDTVNGLKHFFKEVKEELKKCAWPERSELIESTIVVIISVCLLGFYVGLSDTVVVLFVKVLTTR